MLNSIGKFIELGSSFLIFWLGSGRLVLKLIVCSILKGVISQNFSRCQSPDHHTCSLRPQIGPQRQEAYYTTAGETIEPLKRQHVRVDKRQHPKATPTSRQIEGLHPPSKTSLATALLFSVQILQISSDEMFSRVIAN